MEPHLDLMSLVPPDPHQDLVSLVPTWVASGHGYTVPYRDPPGPVNSGLHLGHTWMVTLVPTWVSPGPGESDPHLGLTCNW